MRKLWKFFNCYFGLFTGDYAFSKCLTLSTIIVFAVFDILIYSFGTHRQSIGETIVMTFVAPFVLTSAFWVIDWGRSNERKDEEEQ